MLEVGEEPDNASKTSTNSVSHAEGGGTTHTTRSRRAGAVEWTAGRGAMARRGDAAAIGGSGRRQEDLGVAVWTACHGATTRRGGALTVCGSVQPRERPQAAAGTMWHGATARRGDAAAARESVQPREEPLDGGVAASRGDATATRCSTGGGVRRTWGHPSRDLQRRVQPTS